MNYLTYILLEGNPIKSMSDSFRGTSEIETGMLLQVIALIIIIVLLAVLLTKIHFRHKKLQDTREYKLFEDMLDIIQLNNQEKDVLRQMVREARLKQPAMCLVTPSLMEKSKELWLKEKGQKLIKDGKIKVLNDITNKLHDYTVVS